MEISSFNQKRIEEIHSKLTEDNQILYDKFLKDLFSQTEKNSRDSDQLISHFLDAYIYLLETGKDPVDICNILDPLRLNDFYVSFKPVRFELDNAAVGFCLSLEDKNFKVYRVAISLKKKVEPVLLQIALDLSLKRFPIYTCVLKNGFFWPFLETTNNVTPIKQDRCICEKMKPEETALRMFNLLYSDNKVSLEISHILTDASGALVFLKCIIREYARLVGENITFPDSFFNCQDSVHEEESENAYKKIKRINKTDKLYDNPTVQFKADRGLPLVFGITNFDMSNKAIINKAHSLNVTVTTYMLAVLMLACKTCIEDKHGFINIELPVNMRKLHKTESLRNFSMFSIISCSTRMNRIDALAKEINKQIEQKCSKDAMYSNVISTRRMIDLTSPVPYFLKSLIIKTIYKKINSAMYISILSNLGLIDDLSDTGTFIDSYEFVLLPWNDNMTMCTLLSCGDLTRLTVGVRMYGPQFIDSIHDILNAEGIENEVFCYE